MTDPLHQQSRLKALIAKGKEQGYLTYAEVNDHLPQDISDPDQVEEWYMGIYIDAIEWVEMPNTRGMALFSDGGLIASKPYAASGNYINKMSDYCSDCKYDVKQRTGENSCPFNSLYWDFINRHAEQLIRNPRASMAVRTFNRFDDTERQSIQDRATWCRDHQNSL